MNKLLKLDIYFISRNPHQVSLEPISDTRNPHQVSLEPISDTRNPHQVSLELISDTRNPHQVSLEPISDTRNPHQVSIEPISDTRNPHQVSLELIFNAKFDFGSKLSKKFRDKKRISFLSYDFFRGRPPFLPFSVATCFRSSESLPAHSS